MLGQAINHLKSMGGTAAERAAAFEIMAGEISRLSGGSWNAVRSLGTDGAHIFTGELGHAVVISPSGAIFRGNINPAAGQFSIGADGSLLPIYNALRLIQ